MVYAFNKLKLLSGKHCNSEPGDPEFDASEYPMIVYNLVAQVMTYVSDPEAVQDMYNKHSKHIDKHPMVIDIFEPIFGRDVFALMHTNLLWKTNRKACAHMFYKERLRVMIDVFKLHLNTSCDKWLAEISSSSSQDKNGETRIDISCEFERIFAHTINHVCFGEDYNDDKFEIFFYEHSTKKFSKKLVSMREAMSNIVKQTFVSYIEKFMHPIGGPLQILFGITTFKSELSTMLHENSKRLSKKVLSYVQDRKKGITKSKMNSCDLLAVFLEDQELFNDELIVRNLLGFIFAATETTHFASQTLISHLTQSKDSLSKVR